jgi:hypothetical protein
MPGEPSADDLAMTLLRRFLWGGDVGFSPVAWLLQAVILFIGGAFMISDGVYALGIPVILGGGYALRMMIRRMHD